VCAGKFCKKRKNKQKWFDRRSRVASAAQPKLRKQKTNMSDMSIDEYTEDEEDFASQPPLTREQMFSDAMIYKPVGQLLTRQEFFDLMVKLDPEGCDGCDIDFEQDFLSECQEDVWKEHSLLLWTWQHGDHAIGEENKAYKMFIIGRQTRKELDGVLVGGKWDDVFTNIQEFELYGPEELGSDDEDYFPHM
jgi:hypothetical protein